ncbi:MAG: hypothetical protein Q8K58_08950 [Acidimicrobiales bacterium]|nr:hypothetical protein [Acidimicrobiales bacterium]
MAARSDADPAGGSSPSQGKTIPEIGTELWELASAYAKQETIDPLKGLGRFLGYGVFGSVLLGIGVCLLLLSGLRALQTETSTTFTGNWSWAPYLIVAVVGSALIALALLRVSRRKGPGA